MATVSSVVATLVFLLAVHLVLSNKNVLQFVSRDVWKAQPPKTIEQMALPVPFVIIHHSYMPPACYSLQECIKAMQWMQEFHQEENKWSDIGYTFGVGSDARVYTGRGWTRVGAHAPLYNNRSVGICLIGDYRHRLPPPEQLRAVKNLINYGVENGLIAKNYTLYGHQQVRNGTECPGEALLNEISKWDHFSWKVDEKWYPPTKQ